MIPNIPSNVMERLSGLTRRLTTDKKFMTEFKFIMAKYGADSAEMTTFVTDNLSDEELKITPVEEVDD